MSNSSQRVRQNRRLLAVVPMAAVAALALTACSNSQEPSNEPPGVGPLPTVFTPSPAPSAAYEYHPQQNEGVVTQPTVVADVEDASGASVGSANFVGSGEGTTITLEVHGMTPGFHSLAVTSVGQCDAATAFESAGPVLNDPANATEGLPKDGDLPTLLVDAQGNGKLTTTSTGLAINSLVNAPGTALVIGSDANSTTRIACGVLANAE